MEGVGRRRVPPRACRNKKEITENATEQETVTEVQNNISKIKKGPGSEPREKQQIQKPKPKAKPKKKCVVELPKDQAVASTSTTTVPDPKSKVEIPRDKKQFVGRLEWMQDHSDKPFTSTPLIMPSKIFSQRDVQSCFGFDDEKADSNTETEISGENIHQLSSICKEKVNFEPMRRSPLRPENAQFNSLLVRYGMLEEKDKKEIPKTYTKKRPIVLAKRNVIFGETPKTKRRGSTKNSKKTKAKSDENTDAKPKKQARQKKKPEESDAAVEWIEKKNREFENIMNFPMCVE